MDLVNLGARRTMVVIDPALTHTEVGETVTGALDASSVGYDVYDAIKALPDRLH